MATEDTKTVALVDPQGREYNSSSPIEVSRLVYTGGYRLAGGLSFNDAVNALTPGVVVDPPEGEPEDDEPEDEPVYDRGGLLPPGPTSVINTSPQAQPVLAADAPAADGAGESTTTE